MTSTHISVVEIFEEYQAITNDLAQTPKDQEPPLAS